MFEKPNFERTVDGGVLVKFTEEERNALAEIAGHFMCSFQNLIRLDPGWAARRGPDLKVRMPDGSFADVTWEMGALSLGTKE